MDMPVDEPAGPVFVQDTIEALVSESAEKGQKANKKGKHTNHTKVLSLIIINPYLHSVGENHWFIALFAEFIPVIERFWAMQWPFQYLFNLLILISFIHDERKKVEVIL